MENIIYNGLPQYIITGLNDFSLDQFRISFFYEKVCNSFNTSAFRAVCLISPIIHIIPSRT